MDCAGDDGLRDTGTAIYLFFHLLNSIRNSSGDDRSCSDIKTASSKLTSPEEHINGTLPSNVDAMTADSAIRELRFQGRDDVAKKWDSKTLFEESQMGG